MGLIALEGMKFYAFHGFYEEERLIGNDYIVDVYLTVNFATAAHTDNLDKTVNYETIYRIAKIEMAKPTQLLEAIANRIIETTIDVCNGIQSMKVRITKENPPMGARIGKAYIEMEDSFVVQCNKCSKAFISYDPEDCWTNHGMVYPETRATLTRNYGPYICKRCLTPHFIKERN